MPYIVPSTAVASSCSTITPPHSPSRPPLALSIALASPAPVPTPTPFTPPELPTSPRIAFTSVSSSRFFGFASRKVTPPNSIQQPPPLVKALSETNTPSIANSSSPPTAKGPSTSSSPPMRRAASASSASPAFTTYQHANSAGTSLPHIPRRRIHCGMPTIGDEMNNESSPEQPHSPTRGRTRSRFVLGDEEESGSGSGEERKRGVAKGGHGDKVEVREAEAGVACKRPASTEHLSLETTIPLSLSKPPPSRASLLKGDVSDSDGSDCVTPTQKKLAGRHGPGDSALEPESLDTEREACCAESTVPGIAPHARRGHAREEAWKLAFGNDSEDQAALPKDEKSTVTFPISSPTSPAPFIAVNTPTPVLTPFSSPQDDLSSKSFAGKRAHAGSLRLDFPFGDRSAEWSDPANRTNRAMEHGRALSESASLNSIPPIRKKSGEVVRPSLKSRSSSLSCDRQRPSLSLGDISSLAAGSPSISAPTTPITPTKSVHFDAQLEHVRVFKSTSRPVAVSRDGSPTYDDTTSGGEGDSASEGPPSIDYFQRPRPRRLVPGGSMGEEEEALRRVLMMRVLNMPHRNPEMDNADVRLECLHLADDAASVQGIVRVRNIAFEKSVAVRFTFDGWQTTSEVLGRWSESCIPGIASPSSIPNCRAVSAPVIGPEVAEPPMATFDRFTFSIRLADLLLRIDEKTLVLAVRYNSAGREIWDNNDGQNYRAVFERRPQHSLTLVGSAVVPPGPDRTKEKGTGEGAGGRLGGIGGMSSNGAVSGSGKAGSSTTNTFNTLEKAVVSANSRFRDGKPLSPIKKSSDLSSRYDIDSSLKNPSSWQPSLEHAQVSAGRGLYRENALTRPAIPWSAGRPSHESMGKFGAGLKPRAFESHSLSFNAHGLARGSPRDVDRDSVDDSDVERFSRARFAAVEDVAISDGMPLPRFHTGATRFVSPPSSWISTGPETHARNHHRSSYFDSWVLAGPSTSGFGTGKARLTPPGTPSPFASGLVSDSDVDDLPLLFTSHSEKMRDSSPGRSNSFPPLIPGELGGTTAGLGLIVRPLANNLRELGRVPSDSDASTPSITSVSSPTTTASPSSPPELSVMPSMHASWNASLESTSPDKSGYKAFVDRFCFFQSQLDIPGTEIRRTHSASDLQDLLTTPPPSSGSAFPLIKGPAPISTGLDSRSGTPTPKQGPPSPGVMSPPPTSAGLLETETGVSTRVRC